jgi:ribonuclease HI
MINNIATLNLFSDASMRNYSKSNNLLAGCYGSVAVAGDRIIDEDIRCTSITTVPAAELRGLRLSLGLALTYRSLFKVINIFSDSQVSLFGLRDYIYNWKQRGDTLYTTGNKPVANQSIFIECYQLLTSLQTTNNIKLYHQSGHVDNGYENLNQAARSFGKSNHVKLPIDLNLIRYISTYNNYVDSVSRSMVRRTNMKDKYIDPLSFIPKEGKWKQ